MEVRRFVGLLWGLSGIPVGVALIFLPDPARLACFTLFVLLETGHSLSPIALAWTHTGFRRVMLCRPQKYLLLPAVVFGLTLAVGVATSAGWTSYVPGPHHFFHLTDWTNPFPVVVWIYWLWNIYHFGMQHFGVLALCRGGARSRRQRHADMALCLAVTAFGMAALPKLASEQWVFFLTMGIFAVNHWVVDIGLSSRVSKHGWLFAGGVLLAGAIGFVWMIPTPKGILIKVIPVIICARLGLGFVHFLYSRWVWNLSDPQVGATIGEDFFPWPAGGQQTPGGIPRCAGPMRSAKRSCPNLASQI
jgi:hypothetical protein